jgi:hypothetical protein
MRTHGLKPPAASHRPEWHRRGKRVAASLAPLLDPPTLAWLQAATAPIAGG